MCNGPESSGSGSLEQFYSPWATPSTSFHLVRCLGQGLGTPKQMPAIIRCHACFCAGSAAQSLLAALGSVQFVTNVIFAKYLLHERVSSVNHQHALVTPSASQTCTANFMWLHPQASEQVLLATGIVAAGCVILVCFGNHQSQMLSVDDMLRLYRRCETTCRCSLFKSLQNAPTGAIAICTGKAPADLQRNLPWSSRVYISYLLFMAAGSAAFWGLYLKSKQVLECATPPFWHCCTAQPNPCILLQCTLGALC